MSRTSNVAVNVILVTFLSAASATAAVVVRSVDIVNGEVKAVDLATSAVTNKKLASNSVNGAKLDESSLGIVPNADQLDGRDSSSFLTGPGQIVAAQATVNRGTMGAVFSFAQAGQIGFNIAYQCPTGLVPPLIEFRDRSGLGWDIWFQDGGDDPTFYQLAAGATALYPAFQQSHAIKFRISRGATFPAPQATIVYSLTDAGTSCRTAALAILN